MTNLNPGLHLQNLTLSYERHPAVHHLSGSFLKGSSTAILGPNGGGKSTLLRALAGLHSIDEGQLTRVQLPLELTALLSQTMGFDKDFPITVTDVIQQGFLHTHSPFQFWRKLDPQQKHRLQEALHWTHLEPWAYNPLRTLSFGQLQRVRWARMMVQDPELFLLDEPFVGIDEQTTTDFLKLFELWKSQNKTLIVILHDTQMAIKYFTDCLYLAKTKIYWGPSKSFQTPITHTPSLTHDTDEVCPE